MITNPTVIRTLDTRSLIAVTVTGSNGDNVGGTVTVSKDGTSYTSVTDANGQCNIFVDSPGTWAVGYDKSGITASGSVSVVYSGYTYSVSLSIIVGLTVTVENPTGGSVTVTYNGNTNNAPYTFDVPIDANSTAVYPVAGSNGTEFRINGSLVCTISRIGSFILTGGTIRFYGSSDTYTSLTVNPGDHVILTPIGYED